MGEMRETALTGDGRKSTIGRVTLNNGEHVWKRASEIISFIYLKLYAIHISLCVYIYSLNEVIPFGLTVLPPSSPRAIDYLTKTQIPGKGNSL